MDTFNIGPLADFESHSADWAAREELAERLIPLIGRLYREHGVVTSIHGHRLVNLSTTAVISAHERTHELGHDDLTLEQTERVLRSLLHLQPAPSTIDVARVVMTLRDVDELGVDDRVRFEVENAAIAAASEEQTDVVLYGFGRIGRLLARILIGQGGNPHGLRLRAIVVRRGSGDDLGKRASLLSRDSVHGRFAGSVSVDVKNDVIIANGTRIQVIYSNDPASVDYNAYGIQNAIIVDNTGKWRDEQSLLRHLLSPGASRVLLTAPGEAPLKNVVHGVNDDTITPGDRILSAASCTTNAITPVLKAIHDAYGVEHGHIETVHSFTNDQNLIDNYHSGDRRGRSAVLNMVLTETGAATAVAKALPELAGRLTGSSIRVPTPDVSLAILNLTLERPTTKNEVNGLLRHTSLHSRLRQQIDYVTSPEAVSSDFVGSTRAGIVDGLATISNDRRLVLYVWYDNEYGYSCQVVRVLEKMAGTHPTAISLREEVQLPVAALS